MTQEVKIEVERVRSPSLGGLYTQLLAATFALNFNRFYASLFDLLLIEQSNGHVMLFETHV